MSTSAWPPPGDNFWRVGPGKKTCRHCGEDRLTTLVEDARGKQIYCGVCSHSWWVEKQGCSGD